MSDTPRGNAQRDAGEDALTPRARDERAAMIEVSARLRTSGVSLDGTESAEELVNLLEAVERFERAVRAHGGDLMVDEGPGGRTREPDDIHFVLPARDPREPVAAYLGRIDDATGVIRRHRRHGS